MSGMMFEGQSSNGAGDLFVMTTNASGVASYVDVTSKIANSSGTANPYNGDELGLPGPIMAPNGTSVYFEGWDSSSQVELYVYNETTQKSVEITPSNTWGPGLLSPQDLVSYDGDVYFNGWDGAGNHTLWSSNGTTSGTAELANSPLNPDFMTVYGSEMLFEGTVTVKSGNSTKVVQDLFQYTSGGSISAPIGPTNLAPTNIAVAPIGVKDEPFFGSTLVKLPQEAFMGGKGGGLYEYNGSSVNEVYAGSAPGGVRPQDIVGMTWDTSKIGIREGILGRIETIIPELNGAAFFSGVDSSGGERGLWMSQGSGASTKEVVPSNWGASPAGVSPEGLNPDDLTAINGNLYFTGNDNYLGGTDNGRGLFVYSPSTNTTKELVKSTTMNLIFNGEFTPGGWGNETPTDMTAYRGNLYFGVENGGVGGLYEYNVTTGHMSHVAAAPHSLTATTAFSLTHF